MGPMVLRSRPRDLASRAVPWMVEDIPPEPLLLRAALMSSVCEPHVRRSTTKPRRPQHRSPRAWTRALVLPGLAVAATGLAVSAGLVVDSESPDPAAALLAQARISDQSSAELRRDLDERRGENVSRSSDRAQAERTAERKAERAAERAKAARAQKARAARARAEAQAQRRAAPVVTDPRAIAQGMLPEFGFSADQFSCLDALWTKESGWNVYADNPTSSAYGTPQSLPGSKMATAGADWATNPATQIRWGLGYISARHGSPCSAWSHSQANNWY
jgi:hypothetical protein